MQRRITHYLISVCYLKSNVINFYDFTVERDTYPSRKSIEDYIGASINESSNVTILGISPQTAEQHAQFNSGTN